MQWHLIALQSMLEQMVYDPADWAWHRTVGRRHRVTPGSAEPAQCVVQQPVSVRYRQAQRSRGAGGHQRAQGGPDHYSAAPLSEVNYICDVNQTIRYNGPILYILGSLT